MKLTAIPKNGTAIYYPDFSPESNNYIGEARVGDWMLFDGTMLEERLLADGMLHDNPDSAYDQALQILKVTTK